LTGIEGSLSDTDDGPGALGLSSVACRGEGGIIGPNKNEFDDDDERIGAALESVVV
jgi:hypothetical protein